MHELTLASERFMDCEAVDFCFVGDDWTKLAVVRTDRVLEFHTKHGIHYKTRMPKHARQLAFDSDSCDLFAVGSSSQAFRLNLEQGRFLTSFETAMPAINTVDVNPVHSLVALGGEGGIVEAWDGRDRRKCGSIALALPASHGDTDVTAFAYASDGLTMAVGTAGGSVALYDLRSSTPLLVKEQGNGEPLRSLVFHGVSSIDNEHASSRAALSAFAGIGPCVISADRRLVKVWDQRSGETRVNVEVDARINNIATYSPDSGLLMMACEKPKLQVYYVPLLGPAPQWCAFIDHMTEELEETQGRAESTTFDNFKFVTRDDLAKVGLEHLLGTTELRPYMHGYFVDMRVYTKMLATVNPFAFEDYRKQRIKERIEEKRATRITRRKLGAPAVNVKLAEQLQAAARAAASASTAAPVEDVPDAASLIDARFRDLFTNPDFALDSRPSRRATYNAADDGEESDEGQLTTPADFRDDTRKLFEMRSEHSMNSMAAATAAALRGGSLTEQLRDVVKARNVPLAVRSADEPTDEIQPERIVREMTYTPKERPSKRGRKQQ